MATTFAVHHAIHPHWLTGVLTTLDALLFHSDNYSVLLTLWWWPQHEFIMPCTHMQFKLLCCWMQVATVIIQCTMLCIHSASWCVADLVVDAQVVTVKAEVAQHRQIQSGVAISTASPATHHDQLALLMHLHPLHVPGLMPN